ncbi:E3 ubiquitin-protein ligase ATL42-like [Tasmannia lanceolata]|uniref:E3 ubiquitin-protein ligase ATL42-like n=1 Tax=Tasmannia lanceolata TaxID=3420 RepID=UPI0040646F0C
MNLICCFLFLFFFVVKAQTNQSNMSNDDDISKSGPSFQPSIAVVIGILSIMFSLTFLLLMYAKFCHIRTSELFNGEDADHQNHGILNSISRFSGIDKTVIESLPFFKFSSLKGTKQGLECAVCLSKFEDSEILRLLPKCKHAFHIHCVDEWLESHSSCPLCRHKVATNDLSNIFMNSNSLRLSRNPSDIGEGTDLELFVHREPENEGSRRFSIGSSFRKILMGKKDELLIPEGGEDKQFLDKFKHRIIVSNFVLKSRWSDVNSSDLLSLNSEMMNVLSSKRFPSPGSNSERFDPKLDNGSSSNEKILKIREEIEMKRLFENKVNAKKKSSLDSTSGFPSTSNWDTSRFLIPSGKRSLSEITNMSRFGDFNGKNRIKDSSSYINNAKEERVRRLWVPIARRTVQWFSGRERRGESQQSSIQISNV